MYLKNHFGDKIVFGIVLPYGLVAALCRLGKENMKMTRDKKKLSITNDDMNCATTDFVGKDMGTLDTPCLVLDIDIFERNLALMRDMALKAGKRLRPHAKTHKCSRAAKLQIARGGCAGVCAAKLSEAEALLDAGIQDVLITSPVVTPAKVERLVSGASRHAGLMCVVDSQENAAELAAAAGRKSITLDVLVDIDPDMGRTGVPFEAAARFARHVASLPGLRLRGIQCYAGHLQHVASFEERSRLSLSQMGKAAAIFRELTSNGLRLDILTGTGTGTLETDLSIPELTDVQVGSYCVMDVEYLGIGGKGTPGRFELFSPALTLMATVISANHQGFVTVDAGLKQLYHTPGAPPRVVGRDRAGWSYEWFGDEHGKVILPSGCPNPALGERLRLVVPHCDPTINLHDRVWVVKGDSIVDCWRVDLRGLGQ